MMRAVRGSGNRTTELRFRFALVGAGLRGWTTNNHDLPGHPDFIFRGIKLAVFLDGCLWHGCPVCRHPFKTRRSFWNAKIARNRQRDRKVTRQLRARQFRVLRFWEHDLDDLRRCIEELLMTIEVFPEYLSKEGISRAERRAVARARRAGINAPASAVLSWVRSVGPEALRSAKLGEILTVANAF